MYRIAAFLTALVLAIPASCATVDDLINRAGNAQSDEARLLALKELVEHPELPAAQRDETQRFIKEIERFAHGPRLEYFSRTILDNEDYDFGIAPESPLYPLTHLYRGRMLLWVTLGYGGRWGGDARRARMDMVRGVFEKAREAFPDEPLARMYLGEPVPPTFTYVTPENAPAWAVAQREGLERLTDIIHWWIDHRLQDNGQYGGGWGDDCEMWRFWTPILMGFEDPKIRAAQEKFSTALLSQEHMKDGYTTHVYDVEHTSEDSSDAITPMLHLAPESDVWQQRAMRLVDLSQNLWMGRNDRGQLQYKSTYFSVNEVDLSPKRSCDTVYHPRTIQPALLLWQRNRNPDMTAFVRDWMDTWVDAAARAERGKPAGVIPSAIHWPDGTVGGTGENWWNPENHSSDPLYTYPSAMSLMTHTLLQTYHITGEEKYLAPVKSMAALRLDYLQNSPEGALEPGSAAWCASRMRSLSSVLSKYRLLTGNEDFDALLQEDASTYARFRFWGDEEPVLAALEQNARALRNNFAGYTVEVRYTDRVLRLPALYGENGMYPDPVPGFEAPEPDLLYATATGDPGMSYMFPLNAVRWKTPARNIAALVTEADTTKFTARLYHFGRKPRAMGATLFLLEPGEYTLSDGDQESPLRVTGPKAEIAFSLPPREVVEITIERLSK